MIAKPYKAKSLKAAEREVRNLRRQLARTTELLDRYAVERKLMARLSSKEPQFSNPLEVWEAQKICEEIVEGKR